MPVIVFFKKILHAFDWCLVSCNWYWNPYLNAYCIFDMSMSVFYWRYTWNKLIVFITFYFVLHIFGKIWILHKYIRQETCFQNVVEICGNIFTTLLVITSLNGALPNAARTHASVLGLLRLQVKSVNYYISIHCKLLSYSRKGLSLSWLAW